MTEAAPVIDTCKTCRAWKRGSREHGSNKWVGKGCTGTCRLGPPSFLRVEGVYVQGDYIAFWQPMTHEDDWCTHHASAAGARRMTVPPESWLTRADGGRRVTEP